MKKTTRKHWTAARTERRPDSLTSDARPPDVSTRASQGRLYPRHQPLKFIDADRSTPLRASEAVTAFQTAMSGLEWFSKTLPVFVIVAAGLAAAYVYDFKVTYGIPLSLSSPTMIGTWPIVFGFVILATTAFAALVMSPSAVMWISVERRRRLIDGHRPRKGSGVRNPLGGTDLGRAWMTAQVIAVGMILLGMSVFDEWPWLASGLMIIAVTFATVALDGVRRTARISRWGVVGMIPVITYCLFVQCAGATVIFKFAFSLASDNPSMTEALHWSAGISMCIFVVCLQYFFARGVKGGLRLEAVQQALFICLGFAVIPLGSEAFAARLPATLFQEHDKLRQPCVRLVASSEAVAADWEGIADSRGTEAAKVAESRDLAYVALLDGYQVKVTMDGDTTTIPSKQVRRITSCKDKDDDDDATSVIGEPPH